MPALRNLTEIEIAKMSKVTVKSTGQRIQARSEYDQIVTDLPLGIQMALDLGEGEAVLNVKNRLQAAVVRHNADPKNATNQIALVATSRRGEEKKVYVTKVAAENAPPKQNKGFRKAIAESKPTKGSKKS